MVQTLIKTLDKFVTTKKLLFYCLIFLIVHYNSIHINNIDSDNNNDDDKDNDNDNDNDN